MLYLVDSASRHDCENTVLGQNSVVAGKMADANEALPGETTQMTVLMSYVITIREEFLVLGYFPVAVELLLSFVSHRWSRTGRGILVTKGLLLSFTP